jgi:hypothetical protein
MNWDELQKLWQARTGGGVSHGRDELRTLIAEYETKSGRWARVLRRREYREAIAALFVAGGWVTDLCRYGDEAWPLMVSIMLVLGVAAFELRELWRRARGRLPVHATLNEKVDADLAELRRQRWLLSNVWSWYLAPIVSGCLIEMNVTIRMSGTGSGVSRIAAGLVIIAIVVVLVWALNRRAVRRQIAPEIAYLEKLKATLTSFEAGDESGNS